MSRALRVGFFFFLLCYGSFKMPEASTAENFKETFYLWIISEPEEKFKTNLHYMALEIPITNIYYKIADFNCQRHDAS